MSNQESSVTNENTASVLIQIRNMARGVLAGTLMTSSTLLMVSLALQNAGPKNDGQSIILNFVPFYMLLMVASLVGLIASLRMR